MPSPRPGARPSRGLLQRHRVRPRDVRPPARPRLDPAQPRRGRDDGRSGRDARRFDPRARAPRALGDRVNALRVPYLGRAVDSAGREGRFWSRIARAVMRRPVISLVASAALLLAAAVPVLDLKLSEPGIRSFPDDAPSKLGFAALEEAFGIGTVDTVIVAVEADGENPAVRTAVRELATERPRAPPSATPRSRSLRTECSPWSRPSSSATAATTGASRPSSGSGTATFPRSSTASRRRSM